VDKILIEKRRQLTAGEKGVYWALAKRKKGYSTINKELWLLLVAAFNDHPLVLFTRKCISVNPHKCISVKSTIIFYACIQRLVERLS